MSCGNKHEEVFVVGEGVTFTLTLGAVRDAARKFSNYQFQRGLFQLIPDAFRLRGLKNRFKCALEHRYVKNNEDYVREVLRMSEEKSTFALPDSAQVTFKAGHLRKCAAKMCSDWRKGLEMLFPEAFERVRIYPDLVDRCFVKSSENIPCLVRMDDDGTWRWINLKTGKGSDWKRIHVFEEELAKNGCIIISKEEACALI